jgi:phosphatidylinositol alpha-1,6-mannosyltransferase
MKHLLVTNDFPPKVGGIQSYLWELWRRLPADSTTVLTTPHEGSAIFDAQQPFRIERDRARVLLPTKALAKRVDALATDVGADLVLLDPAVPLGIVGPWLEHPYGVVLHGAEVTVPGRLPILGRKLGGVLRGAQIVISAGGYPAAEARRCAGRDLSTVIIPPGVDPHRFTPLGSDDRRLARIALGLDPDAPVILGLSRLVPRKGFDVLIDAGAILAKRYPGLQIVLAGSGRDRQRLERRARRRGSPVTFLGRVDDDDLSPLLASSDVFAMLCRNRWGGLEQEGFGIVFLEAAAAGVASVAGRSGGSAEAVDDGVTGVVVEQPKDIQEVVNALDRLLGDAGLRSGMGRAGRLRAESTFTYDRLAAELHAALQKLGTNP